MSAEVVTLECRNGGVKLVSFWGGERDGICLQLTSEKHNYIQLTKHQAKVLAEQLIEFSGKPNF